MSTSTSQAQSSETSEDTQGKVLSYSYKEAVEDQVVRLYEAYFLRTPDPIGLEYWKNQIVLGRMNIEGVSEQFALSSEFQTRYNFLSNEQFVNLVYLNVLSRNAETEGANYWLTQLNSGMLRGEMMLSFSDSSEFINRTATDAAPLSSYVHAPEIERLFGAYFEREPSRVALDHYTVQRESGVALSTISQELADSDEFRKTYALMSDAEFVNLVYKNTLNRLPNTAEKLNWQAKLNSGTSRGQMMSYFTESHSVVNQKITVNYNQARGQRALAEINYDWETHLDDWSIVFEGYRSGYLGLAEPGKKLITIYIRPDQSDSLLEHVIAHEMGHAVDVMKNSSNDRNQWQAARNIGAKKWWPSSAAPDHYSGAGDFAEAFAYWQVGHRGHFGSHIAGVPNSAQVNLMATLAVK